MCTTTLLAAVLHNITDHNTLLPTCSMEDLCFTHSTCRALYIIQCSSTVYRGSWRLKDFGSKRLLQNHLNIYILTVGWHWLGIAKPKKFFRSLHQIVIKFKILVFNGIFYSLILTYLQTSIFHKGWMDCSNAFHVILCLYCCVTDRT